MPYETPGVAFNALESLYRDFSKRADKYAAKENANPNFVEVRYRELVQMYEALEVLELTCQDATWHKIANVVKQMLKHDSSMGGVIIELQLKPNGTNYGHLTYTSYADPTY